jgi:hypothetical protein
VFRRQVRSDDTTTQQGLSELRARSIRVSVGLRRVGASLRAVTCTLVGLVGTHLANHLALQTSVEDAHLRFSHTPRKAPSDLEVVRIQRMIRRIGLERHFSRRVGYGEGVAWVTVPVDQSGRLRGRQVAKVVGDCGADGIDWGEGGVSASRRAAGSLSPSLSLSLPLSLPLSRSLSLSLCLSASASLCARACVCVCRTRSLGARSRT